ncbi:MAG: ornithine acetyltransferase [Candidatus Anoxymicrobium japonicum]|uniref:Arginine biosynthesis bifunctional protein ArgJ n=1 Tax=Candidatus Anoxymicrobium japonicum TaxID=2013648 RepID=A0A2N3G844_9ACTN|nr:MAG: ornithine acetyltransferase [Candidatus Anoxymicrobium japonicum]
MNAMGFERILGGVCAPKGFLASGVACGIKAEGKPDLALLYSEFPAAAAGVFTTNEMKAAPVKLCKEIVDGPCARAVVINSGCANAMTGKRGDDDAHAMVRFAEKALGVGAGQVLVASTGHIGEYLLVDKVTSGIKQAVDELSVGGNTDAAKAIMTTDSYPKELAAEMEIGGKVVRLGAMAKGAGMMHPNMATMIAVITTDLALPRERMSDWLKKSVEWSFNRITVDGDQSTNDTVLMLANGAAFPDGHVLTDEEADLFFRVLCWLTGRLARSLVKDGEGAGKLLRVVVNSARDDVEAERVARAIANSNLVKCSLYGGSVNVGRIAAAAGSAGVSIEQSKLAIYVGEHKVVEFGEPVEHDPRDIEKMTRRGEVEVTVSLGVGLAAAQILTCDLSKEYVAINAGE